MKYALQQKGYGLGNFIMLTPALRLLNKKVNVFFESKNISSLFRDCPFINTLNSKPKGKPFITSEKPKRAKGESDIRAYCRKISKYAPKLLPNTYVDKCNDMPLLKEDDIKYVAMFHGCLGPIFRKRKNLDVDVRQMMIDKVIERGHIPVLLGSAADNKHFWHENNTDGCVNYLGQISLRESVSILNQCDFFVSNDTGLYHVAGALEKNGLVMWYKTDITKNMCLFNGIEHIQSIKRNKDVYEESLDRFLEKQ